jgi:hypothetical protein
MVLPEWRCQAPCLQLLATTFSVQAHLPVICFRWHGQQAAAPPRELKTSLGLSSHTMDEHATYAPASQHKSLLEHCCRSSLGGAYWPVVKASSLYRVVTRQHGALSATTPSCSMQSHRHWLDARTKTLHWPFPRARVNVWMALLSMATAESWSCVFLWVEEWSCLDPSKVTPVVVLRASRQCLDGVAPHCTRCYARAPTKPPIMESVLLASAALLRRPTCQQANGNFVYSGGRKPLQQVGQIEQA